MEREGRRERRDLPDTLWPPPHHRTLPESGWAFCPDHQSLSPLCQQLHDGKQRRDFHLKQPAFISRSQTARSIPDKIPPSWLTRNRIVFCLYFNNGHPTPWKLIPIFLSGSQVKLYLSYFVTVTPPMQSSLTLPPTLHVLNVSLLQHTWFQWTGRYQASAEARWRDPYFNQVCWGGRIGKHCSNVAAALFLYDSDELPLPEGVEHRLHPELHFCRDWDISLWCKLVSCIRCC